MAKKRQEIVIEELLKRGSKELKSDGKKYRKFTHPNRDNEFYWVGDRGALRVGKTLKASFSISWYFKGGPK